MISRRAFIQQALALSAAGGLHGAHASAPIHCVYGESYAPWSWSEGGAIKGLAPELVSAFLGERLNRTLIHAGLPWKRAQTMIERGDADVMCTIPTSARRDYALLSEKPLFATSTRAFIARESSKRETLLQANDLESMRQADPLIVTYLGSGWSVERFAGFRTVTAPSMDNCLKMLAAGRADLMVENRLVGYRNIAELALKDQIIEGRADLEVVPYHVMLSKKSQHLSLMDTINVELPAFKSTPVYRRIVATYLRSDT